MEQSNDCLYRERWEFEFNHSHSLEHIITLNSLWKPCYHLIVSVLIHLRFFFQYAWMPHEPIHTLSSIKHLYPPTNPEEVLFPDKYKALCCEAQHLLLSHCLRKLSTHSDLRHLQEPAPPIHPLNAASHIPSAVIFLQIHWHAWMKLKSIDVSPRILWFTLYWYCICPYLITLPLWNVNVVV